jgi:hypothetical protein
MKGIAAVVIIDELLRKVIGSGVNTSLSSRFIGCFAAGFAVAGLAVVTPPIPAAWACASAPTITIIPVADGRGQCLDRSFMSDLPVSLNGQTRPEQRVAPGANSVIIRPLAPRVKACRS